MTPPIAKLRFQTPTEAVITGRGFYQLEEDALYVQVGPFDNSRRFFSYLEGDHVRLDIDRHGRLIFIEVDVARRHWQVADNLCFPENARESDIRWLDFRKTITDPQLITNRLRTILRLEFACANPSRAYRPAEHIVIETDENDHLVAIWIEDIIDDLAGQEIAAYRKQVRGSEHFFEQKRS
ncbi:MAG: hypothetical protein KOO62_12500 [candidate division Zixibacteria bacterium]|nr:hypothetical protein [candidate division Zixibacteria bacterium]